MKPFLNGILTGLFLQLAVGPVFFYILGITIDSSYSISLYAIFAVTLVDYIYISLSIIGVGALLQQSKVKQIFGLTSAIILLLFGALIFSKGLAVISQTEHINTFLWTPMKSFTSCFVLTISSPLTIIFFSSIFSTKAIEHNYRNKQLIMFGIGTGAATFIFLASTMMIIALLKADIPGVVINFMNCFVGALLVFYGISRVTKLVPKSSKDNGP